MKVVVEDKKNTEPRNPTICPRRCRRRHRAGQSSAVDPAVAELILQYHWSLVRGWVKDSGKSLTQWEMSPWWDGRLCPIESRAKS